MKEFIEQKGILVATEAWPLLQQAGLTNFDAFMDFSGGTRVVHKRGRSVFRFEAEGRAFYLKRNRLNRVEFLKSLFRGRWPRLGARIEWENIFVLEQTGIPTVSPVAMGERFRFGLETESFTLTEEIYGAEPLNVYMQREYIGPKSESRLRDFRQVIGKMAALARRFHCAGLNHQDFYLNHFFVGEDGRLYLLDLQRVQKRRKVPPRYLVKDLGQLLYSVDSYGVGTRTDRMRFLLSYLGRMSLGASGKHLAMKICQKKIRIARHDVKLMARRRRRGELPPV